MATRFVQQGGAAVAPIYAGQQQAIAGQMSDVDALYNAMVQGVESQQATNLADITASAQQRGVYSPEMARQTAASLGQAGQLAGAQLGVGRAANQASLAEILASLGVGRQQAAVDFGGLIQQRDLAERNAQLERQKLQQEYNLGITEAEREAELNRQERELKQIQSDYSRRYSSSGGSGGGSRRGGSQQTANGPRYSQRQDGGFNFVDGQGRPISAAKYAQLTGQDVRSVLGAMGQAGDKYAAQVYNQLRADPFVQKNEGRYKQLYSSIFWGA